MTRELNEWVVTDPDCNQKGRKLGPGKYQFTQDNYNDGEIDLDTISIVEIESCINSFGYSLLPPHVSQLQNIYKLYPDMDDAEWIIAECIYEIEAEICDDYDPSDEREGQEMREEQDAFDREMYG